MVDSRAYAFEGSEPSVHVDARVSAEAVLVGDVRVAAGASVWPGAVLRGDAGVVRVGPRAHVGDGAVLHCARLEARGMVGHGAVLDEATVEGGALVGHNATINSGAVVGADSIVAAGSVVEEGQGIPAESFVRGIPAEVTPLSETDIDAGRVRSAYSSGAYTDLANRHGALFD